MYSCSAVKESQLHQMFVQMEKDLGLLDEERYGKNARLVWEASRVVIGGGLRDACLDTKLAHSPLPRPWMIGPLYFIKWCINITINATVMGWLTIRKKPDWLVMQHSRKKKNSNGYYEDIYTQCFIDSLRIRGQHIAVVTPPCDDWTHPTPSMQRCHYSETWVIFSRILMILRVMFRKTYSTMINQMANDVQEYIKEKTGLDLSLKDKILKEERQCYARYKVAKIFLMIKRPRNILLVVSYGLEPVIQAAKCLKIPVVEVQHGTISKHHLGYSFDGQGKRTFPDHFLSFGKFWESMVSLPISKHRIHTVGFPYLEREIKKWSTWKKENLVIIISQGTIGDRISRFAIDLASLYAERGIRFVFKLHPGECSRWRNEYPWLHNAVGQGIIEVDDDSRTSIYLWLAKAKWQIGVYSTALFEGVAFGCSTVLVKMPGIGNMENFIRVVDPILVSRADELTQDFKVINEPVNKDIFFYPKWEERWIDALRLVSNM